jgi:hypothetical protein
MTVIYLPIMTQREVSSLRVRALGLGAIIFMLAAAGCSPAAQQLLPPGDGALDSPDLLPSPPDDMAEPVVVPPSKCPAQCDDFNPCTTDRCDDDAGCVHQPAGEGVACDDGKPCTINDSCRAGACAGDPAPENSAPSILGTAFGYGGYRDSDSDVQGLSAFVGDDLVVYANQLYRGPAGTLLTLAQIGAGGVTALSHITTPHIIDAGLVGGTNWSYRLYSQLLPLANQRVALITDYNIDIFSTSGGLLKLVTSYPINPKIYVFAGASAGSRFWTCNGSGLQAWSLDGKDNVSLTANLSMPTSTTCYGMAASTDGKTLVIASTKGLLRYDVSGATPVGGTAALTTQAFTDVQLAGELTAVHLYADTGGIGKVRVYKDLAKPAIAEFAETVPTGPPLGFTLVDGGIVVAWFPLAGGCDSIVPVLYDLDDNGATQRSRLDAGPAACFGRTLLQNPVSLSARGRRVAMQPVQTLLDIDPQTRALSTFTGPGHGTLERLRTVSATQVQALGNYSAQLIDVGNPAAPRIVDGGMRFPLQPGSVRAELPVASGFAPYLVTAPFDFIEQKVTVAGLSRLQVGTGLLPAPVGIIGIPGGPARMYAAGGYLYQLLAESSTQVRVRRYDFSTMPGGDGQSASPDLNVVVQASDAPANAGRQLALASDATGAQLVVFDQRYDVHVTYDPLAIGWFKAGAKGLERIASGKLAFGTPVQSAAVVGDRAFAVSYDHAFAIHRDGDTLVTDGVKDLYGDSEETHFTSLLAFDGALAYVSIWRVSQATHAATPGVMVFRASDLSLAARYDTADQVFSMTQAGGNVVFGMKNAVSVAEAFCPAQ